MKNVLLLVHDDSGQEARLQCALDLTRALSGHLFCMDVVQVPVLVGAEFGAAQAQAMLLEDTRETEAANERKIKARLTVEDIAWNWRNGVGDMAPLLIEASNLVDVLVLNTALPSGSGPDMRWIISSVVTESGKPVLAVPPATKKTGRHRRGAGRVERLAPCGRDAAGGGSASLARGRRQDTPDR